MNKSCGEFLPPPFTPQWQIGLLFHFVGLTVEILFSNCQSNLGPSLQRVPGSWRSAAFARTYVLTLEPRRVKLHSTDRELCTEIGSQYKDRDFFISKSQLNWFPQCTYLDASCGKNTVLGVKQVEFTTWLSLFTSLNFSFFFCKVKVNHLPYGIVFRTRGNDEHKVHLPSKYSTKVTFSSCLYLK